MAPDDLERRLVELEMRLGFQEHALAEMNEALAAGRLQAHRQGELLARLQDEIRSLRTQPGTDPGLEPPPPHY